MSNRHNRHRKAGVQTSFGWRAHIVAYLASVAMLTFLADGVMAETAGQPGVYDDRIVFGQTAALEGPAGELGREMRRGILAAFDEVNASGGIQGRRLELISYDDGYEPERAIENAIRLIQDDRVFALIGSVGTPTSVALLSVTERNEVPLIGPFTGAGALREPDLKAVVNLRATYSRETEFIVQWLTENRGYDRISVLYQDDSYGQSGLMGVRQALERRGLSVASIGSYPRNTTAVKQALLDIRRAKPQSVVIIGAYQPAAQFIRWARKLGDRATYVNVSFVGSNALAQALQGDTARKAADTYITQVVPSPATSEMPVVLDYRAAVAEQDGDPETGFVSLEGYLVGRFAAQVLADSQEPNRQAFLATIEDEGDFDLGGFSLEFGPGDNQGSQAVFLTVIEPDGSVSTIEEAAP